MSDNIVLACRLLDSSGYRHRIPGGLFPSFQSELNSNAMPIHFPVVASSGNNTNTLLHMNNKYFICKCQARLHHIKSGGLESQ